MTINKIIVFLASFGLIFNIMRFEVCNATSIKDQYACIFEIQERDSSDIVVQKMCGEDVEVLKRMILNEGPDFAKYLGFGVEPESIDVDELLSDSEDDCNLVVKNKDGVIVGEITISKGSSSDRICLGYWIGKDFRGNGYAFLATSQVISKLWKNNKDLSFEFFIDDENINSIKSFNKICANLKSDNFNAFGTKEGTSEMEIRANKIEGNSKRYNVSIYCNGKEMGDSNILDEEQLLSKYSAKKLNSGILLKCSISQYVLKRVS